ncbi:hypothetical protein PMW_66 [Pseudomonas phage phiPMW]|uniref:Uncharacterized protein n=1 Tax=Pseudomonas phage phiPMW TaxID=1815582 RepID=A0A1S5R199_9CAUD|nr:hypothetical protein FDG97_gp066 [Pseudomonas phage phiPMW]ANA49191.1 hypothetical protein PMW_66 [Pseudomonas phage phiPMW]
MKGDYHLKGSIETSEEGKDIPHWVYGLVFGSGLIGFAMLLPWGAV